MVLVMDMSSSTCHHLSAYCAMHPDSLFMLVPGAVTSLKEMMMEGR